MKRRTLDSLIFGSAVGAFAVELALLAFLVISAL